MTPYSLNSTFRDPHDSLGHCNCKGHWRTSFCTRLVATLTKNEDFEMYFQIFTDLKDIFRMTLFGFRSCFAKNVKSIFSLN